MFWSVNKTELSFFIPIFPVLYLPSDMMTNIWVSSTCLLFCTTAHFMMRVYLISVTELTYCRADWKLCIQYYEFTFDKWVSMCARCPYRRCVHTSGHHGDPAPAAMWPTGWNPTTWLNTVITKHRFVQFPHHELWLFKLRFLHAHTHKLLLPDTFPSSYIEEETTNGSLHSAECRIATRCDWCSVTHRSNILE